MGVPEEIDPLTFGLGTRGRPIARAPRGCPNAFNHGNGRAFPDVIRREKRATLHFLALARSRRSASRFSAAVSNFGLMRNASR